MVAAPVLRRVGRPVRQGRLDVVASKQFYQPAISLWRHKPIVTEVAWRRNGKLYLHRFHPHKNCTGHFVLTCEQVEVLLEFWQAMPWHVVHLPTVGLTRCYAQALPDGGLQLVCLDRRGHVGITFRVIATHVASFLAFVERWLPRYEDEPFPRISA